VLGGGLAAVEGQAAGDLEGGHEFKHANIYVPWGFDGVIKGVDNVIGVPA